MKYETIGGEVRDTNSTKDYLKNLKIGEKFRNVSGEAFMVLGNCTYNASAGTPTRLCENLKTKNREQKQCRIQVIPFK